MEFYKENMDEVFFNYFEGNLDEKEKEELMNFLHQYPEYNDDFTSWAQSYAHTLEKPEDYGMVEKLTREKQPAGIWNKSLLIIIPAILAILFMLSKPSWLKNSYNPEIKFQREYSEAEISQDEPAKSQNAITKQAPKKKKTGKKRIVLKLMTEDCFSMPDTLAVEEPKKITVFEDSSSELNVTNEKAGQTTETKNESSAKPVVKKKKFRISLKPSPNFTPLSPDL